MNQKVGWVTSKCVHIYIVHSLPSRYEKIKHAHNERAGIVNVTKKNSPSFEFAWCENSQRNIAELWTTYSVFYCCIVALLSFHPNSNIFIPSRENCAHLHLNCRKASSPPHVTLEKTKTGMDNFRHIYLLWIYRFISLLINGANYIGFVLVFFDIIFLELIKAFRLISRCIIEIFLK
jgi:hypothetical protein